MKSIFLTVILVFSVFVILPAQENTRLNFKDATGKKQGKWIRTDSAGKKVYEGTFTDDHPTGVFNYYYGDGILKATLDYRNNGRIAYASLFNDKGKLIARGKYTNGIKDSLWTYFSEYDGKPVSDESYLNGRKEGVEHIFYAGKGVSEIITWKDGKREGPWEQYYPDGKFKMKCAYREDLKQGPYGFYENDGSQTISGEYSDGLSEGKWQYFSVDGKLLKNEYFEEGKLIRTEEFDAP